MSGGSKIQGHGHPHPGSHHQKYYRSQNSGRARVLSPEEIQEEKLFKKHQRQADNFGKAMLLAGLVAVVATAIVVGKNIAETGL